MIHKYYIRINISLKVKPGHLGDAKAFCLQMTPWLAFTKRFNKTNTLNQLETLDHTIRIGHRPFYISICFNKKPLQLSIATRH